MKSNLSSKEIYLLVQSMSKTEVRYFKVESKQGNEDAGYIVLFDVLRKMDEFDEELLKKKLKNTKIAKYIPRTCNYLYEAILKSLRAYQRDKSTYAKIKTLLIDIRNLMGRGLENQCFILLAKAKALAEKNCEIISLLEINATNIDLETSFIKKDFKARLEVLILERQTLLKALEKEYACRNFYTLSFADLKSNQLLKDEAEKKRLESFLASIDIKTASPHDFRARTEYYKGVSNYQLMTGNYSQSVPAAVEALKLWKTRPSILKEEFFRYNSNASILLATYFSSHQKEYILPILDEIEANEPTNYIGQKTLFFTVSLYRLIYAMDSGDFETAHQRKEIIKRGLAKHNMTKAQERILLCNIILLEFFSAHFEQTYKEIEDFIKKYKTNRRLEITALIRIIGIISMEEAKETDKALLFYRASLRYFNKYLDPKTHLFYFESLQYVQKIYGAALFDRKPLLEEFKDYLKDKTNLVGGDELLVWTLSNIQGKKLKEIIISRQLKKEN